MNVFIRKPGFAFAVVVAASVGLTCRAAASATPVAAPADNLQAGIAQFKAGQYAQAESTLRTASGPEASAYLAASLVKQKKYADAEAPAKTAIAANATHDVAVATLGESLVGQKKFDEAIAAMSKAIEARADLAYAFFWRGQAHDNKKQSARMVADYQTFLKLAPKAPEAPTVQAILSTLK